MSSFTAPLELTPGRHPLFGWGWFYTRDVTFWVGDLPAPGQEAFGTSFTTPKGSFTNLGDIPRPIALLLPRDDPRWCAAFGLHDDLCRRRGFPRMTAAAIFLEALVTLAQVNQVPLGARWRVWAMFAGVMAWSLLKPYPTAQEAGR